MSSSAANEGPDVPGKKKGLLSRMKTVLKRSNGSKRLSFSSKPAAAQTSASATTEPAVIAGPSTSTAPPPTTTTKTEQPPSQAQPPPGATSVMRSTIHTERALKLAARFAIPIEPFNLNLNPLTPDRPAYRIEKPIRMRIHRTCHRCNTIFGVNRICASCGHARCKACLRYPVVKKEASQQKTKQKEKEEEVVVLGGEKGLGAGEVIEPDTYYGLRETIVLTRPNPKTGGQPLVRKKVMQRVRRTCHECSTLFAPGVKSCASCSHVRCVDCPRDPPKPHKFPNGYPGDAPSSNPNRPLRHVCHKCNKTFPQSIPNPSSDEYTKWKESDAGKDLKCERCSHQLCDSCPRARPVKVDPGVHGLGVDEDVLERVRRRLAGLGVEGGGGGKKEEVS